MKKYDLTTQSMVRIAMFTAVLSVLSVLQIPMPSGVPLTLQTFAVALCGAVLGAWSGPASVALYVAVGAVGIPVFAGMKGGIAVLVGPTGGFLFGFLFLAWLTGAGGPGDGRACLLSSAGDLRLYLVHRGRCLSGICDGLTAISAQGCAVRGGGCADRGDAAEEAGLRACF